LYLFYICRNGQENPVQEYADAIVKKLFPNGRLLDPNGDRRSQVSALKSLLKRILIHLMNTVLLKVFCF